MSGPVRVLIVDDDDDVRETLAVVLELEGFEIATAANGKEALDLILSGGFGDDGPCVVLLDLRMPVMSGWEFLERLRASDQAAGLPILIATSSPEGAPGGLPVMAKPLDIDELFGRLRELAAER